MNTDVSISFGNRPGESLRTRPNGLYTFVSNLGDGFAVFEFLFDRLEDSSKVRTRTLD